MRITFHSMDPAVSCPFPEQDTHVRPLLPLPSVGEFMMVLDAQGKPMGVPWKVISIRYLWSAGTAPSNSTQLYLTGLQYAVAPLAPTGKILVPGGNNHEYAKIFEKMGPPPGA